MVDGEQLAQAPAQSRPSQYIIIVAVSATLLQVH